MAFADVQKEYERVQQYFCTGLVGCAHWQSALSVCLSLSRRFSPWTLDQFSYCAEKTLNGSIINL